MSWNSSTITWSKRSRQLCASAGLEPQQRERAQLEVGEVERRARLLELLVAVVHRLEQALERGPRVDRRGRLGNAQRLGLLPGFADATGSRDLGQPRLDHALAAQPLVGGDRHRREAPGLVGGGGARDLLVAGGEQARRAPRGRPGRAAAPPRFASRTRNAGRGRRRAGGVASSRRQKAWIVITQARSVARASPSSSLGASRVPGGASGARAAGQLAADPGAHLGRGALGEGEGEDPVDLDLVVDDRGAVAVDEHRGLAGAGAGLEEDVARRAAIAAACSGVGSGRGLATGTATARPSGSSRRA